MSWSDADYVQAHATRPTSSIGASDQADLPGQSAGLAGWSGMVYWLLVCDLHQ